jgi:uncharacterized protein
MSPDEIDALADRLIAAIEAADIEAIRAIYAADARIWHNFDQHEQSVEENLVTLAWVVAHTKGRRYEEVRRLVLDDGYVQQHVLRATSRGGAPVEIPAMLRVTCVDGRITRLEEYLDTAQAAALRI